MDSRVRHHGLTVLEVVLASALLVTLGGIILGALSFIERVNVRDTHRLNGMEIAHRVVAQYISDPRELPDEALELQQGDFLYQYVMRDDIIMFDGSDEDIRQNASQVPSRSVSAVDQLGNLNHRLLVEVYVSDPRVPDRLKQLPIARLERFYSPITLGEESLLEWITSVIEAQRNEQRRERERRREEADR